METTNRIAQAKDLIRQLEALAIEGFNADVIQPVKNFLLVTAQKRLAALHEDLSRIEAEIAELETQIKSELPQQEPVVQEQEAVPEYVPEDPPVEEPSTGN